LKMLQGTDTPEIVLTPKFQAEQQRLRANESSAAMTLPKKDPNFVPKLSQENLTFSFSLTPKSNEVAKRRAAEILKKKPLEQTNPNLLKYRGTEAGKKRIAEEFNKSEEGETKKVKIDDKVDEAQKKKDFIKRMMNATSSHADLGESLEREKQQKCFDRLEKKEAMEERMANTTEMSVSQISCRLFNLIKHSFSFAVQGCDLQ
jgi:minichromosome maintenance protein 10